MKAIATDILLGVSAAVVLASCIGVLVMPDAYQKLHFVTPVSLIAPPAVGIAILIQSGWSNQTAQAWLVVGFMMVASPFLSHATIRAARIRAAGDWRGPGAHRASQDGGAR